MNKEIFNDLIVKKDSSNYIKNNKEIFFDVFPILRKMDGFDQRNPHHIYDLFDHSLYTLEHIKNRSVLLCVAALFHDCGKLDCFFLDENKIGRFRNHGNVGSKLIYQILEPMHYDIKFIDKVSLLIKYHDYPINSTKTIENAYEALGDMIFDLFELKKADILSHSEKYRSGVNMIDEVIEKTKEYIRGKTK